MHRFFVDKNNVLEDEGMILINNQDDVKHITKVLRLTEKERVEVCDGDRYDYIGEIISATKTEVRVRIIEKYSSKTEANICITLYQGLPKSAKMDIIVQKCTELGVNQIVPLMTQRTVVQLKDKKSEEKKLERWQKIADEAAKQCKRGILPNISAPITFQQMLKHMSEYDLIVIPYEKEEAIGLKSIIRKNDAFKKVAIIIGPEGGFEEDEVMAAKDAGAVPLTLGPRILRTETAGFVTLSILMYELGDLGGTK
ncbi:16S rRNA (uracil(1498)-N(3))-methyltransferase [Clostridiaceae bacterium 35-E11]